MSLNTHLGTDIPWTAFKGGHNTWTITFTLNSAAHDISAHTFTVRIRKSKEGSDLFTIADGTGLTNGGVSGILSIELSLANIQSYLPGDYYFYIITYVIDGETYALFEGGLTLSINNPGNTSSATTVPVSLAGVSNINAAITLAGGGSGSGEIDGGSASSVYLESQVLDGGDA